MDTNAVIIYNQAQCENITLQFLDILLDETLIYGTIYVPVSCRQTVSTVNKRLPEKQIYEYVLRLAESYRVCLSNKLPDKTADYMVLENPDIPVQKAPLEKDSEIERGLKTDCYLAARYKNILLEHHYFEEVIQCILDEASKLQCRQQVISFLEEMLQGGDAYQYFDQGSRPFLIYRGSKECYQVLDSFAENLGSALRRQGFLVEFFDSGKEKHTALSRYIGKSFQAVIGMQTFLFSALMENGSFLHDKIRGPKYNFVFDHPLWMCRQFQNVPKSLTILTLDRDYASYIRRYYQLNAYFLPPGGIQETFVQQKRIYDVVFIGSFIDNSKDIFQKLRQLERPMRFLINRFWLIMRKEPRLSVENALRQALGSYNGKYILSDRQFMELCYELREYVLYLSQYYRKKLIKTLVNSGIKVDVFGTSWKYCTLRSNPNFVWHNKDLGTQESLAVWQQSKISLNIMSCHKNAVTERIVNSMLQGAAVCTEHNPYLDSQFQDGIDILFYDLANLAELPGKMLRLLADEKQLEIIGANGRRKAEKLHTWDCRASKLIKMAQSFKFSNL